MNAAQELGALLAALRALGPGEPAVLATIVRTRGPSFRRAGASMLVRTDGSLACALSGGCPQRDIVQRALQVLRGNRAEYVRYDAESGLDVMIEMGCDGELDVLIEPLRPQPGDWLDALEALWFARRPGMLVTAYALDAACIAPRRLLWDVEPGHVCHDALDDEDLRGAVIEALQVPPGTPTMVALTGMRGRYDVLLEPLAPQHALLVIGDDGCALALAALGAQLGWRTGLVGEEAVLPPAQALPPGVQRHAADAATLAAHAAFDTHTSVVVMTHNLERDIAWLRALGDRPLAYLGALGSRSRASRMREATGLDGDRLHVPAGLDIGSETPQEIALAVAAELLAHLNGRAGGPLHRQGGPIHGA